MSSMFRSTFVDFPGEKCFLVFRKESEYSNFLYYMIYEIRNRMKRAKAGRMERGGIVKSISFYFKRSRLVVSDYSDVERDGGKIYAPDKFGLIDKDDVFWSSESAIVSSEKLIEKIENYIRKDGGVKKSRIPYMFYDALLMIPFILAALVIILMLEFAMTDLQLSVAIIAAAMLGSSMLLYGYMSRRGIARVYDKIKSDFPVEA